MEQEAQEAICNRKTNQLYNSSLIFNNSTVTQTTSQKHMSVILDSRLIFNDHLIIVLTKVNKAIGLFRES